MAQKVSFPKFTASLKFVSMCGIGQSIFYPGLRISHKVDGHKYRNLETSRSLEAAVKSLKFASILIIATCSFMFPSCR